MMNKTINQAICLAAIAAVTFWSTTVHAHGTPIHVEVAVDNQLVVSQGLADSVGFAPIIFVENDEEGEPFGSINLSGFGPATIWQLPGYDIFGMQENSGLFIEPLARPVKGSEPSENRVLWYWNSSTEIVDDTPPTISLQIRKTPSLHTTLLGSSGTAPPSLQLAAPVASDMGFHNHLVLYAINDPAPTGAYGFFARLTSNLYDPSDPFLVVINNGITDFEQMIPAALAINAAAVLTGDYNNNGVVDAADYTVWRDTLGSTTQLAADGSGNHRIDQADYELWRTNFGSGGSGSGSVEIKIGHSVAEPSEVCLAIIANLVILAKLAILRRR